MQCGVCACRGFSSRHELYQEADVSHQSESELGALTFASPLPRLRLAFLIRIASLMRGFVSKLLKCATMVARTLSDTVRVLLSNPCIFFVLLLHIAVLFILDTILLYIFVRTRIRSSDDLGHALLCDGGWTLGVLCGLYTINRYALSYTTLNRR